jgi:hypothetical protein
MRISQAAVVTLAAVAFGTGAIAIPVAELGGRGGRELGLESAAEIRTPADPRGANPDVDWTALELASGSWAVATGDGIELRTSGTFAPRLVEPFAGAEIEVRLAVAALDMVWIRPGEGAWYAVLRDGAGADRQTDGFVRLSRAAFRPLGDAAPVPGALAATDIVFALDPTTLRFALRKGAAAPATAPS